jgi:hypothetical protein
MASIEALTARLLKATDLDTKVELIEKLVEAARKDGMEDLLIDLIDTDQITPEAVEFAVENNGAPDPRKR